MQLLKLVRKGLVVTGVAGLLAVCGCSSSSCCKTDKSKELTVMSYNIHHGAGIDKVLDLERIAGVIKSENADIVGLNEVDRKFPNGRSDFKEQAKELAAMLGMEYVFEANVFMPLDESEGIYGNAILSRYPIVKSENHKLFQKADEEQRGCIETDIEIDGKSFKVLTAHLDCFKGHEIRTAQVKDVLNIIEKSGAEDVILMGDFNSQAGDEPIELAKESLHDSFELANKSETKSTFGEKIRIDFIFVSESLKDSVKEYRVVKNDVTAKASDHYPIVTKIELK